MSEFRDELKVQGVKARGYGILPKLVMLDRKLTIEAKAIYSYFCSYAGAGTTAFPGIEKIIEDLCISKTRYYNHRSKLVELGYITIEQAKGKNNKFSHNIYTLVDRPIPQNKEAEEIKPITHSSPSPIFKDTGNEYTQNEDTNINNLYNINSSLYNHQSITDDGQTEFKNIIDQVELETFEESKAIEQAIRILYYNDKALKVNNMNIPTNQVRADLKRLSSTNIDSALKNFYKASESVEIVNVVSYLSKCIYNSIFDDDLKIMADINYKY